MRDCFYINFNPDEYATNHPTNYSQFLEKKYKIKGENSISISCGHADEGTRKICIYLINIILSKLIGLVELWWIDKEFKKQLSKDVLIIEVKYIDLEYDFERYMVTKDFVLQSLDKDIFWYG